MQERGEAHRLAARELVGERLAQAARHRVGVLAEARGDRVALDRRHLVEHRERVVVHVEVVEHVLVDAAQRGQLGQHLRGDAVRLHQREAGARGGRADDLLELAEHALGRDPVEAGRAARRSSSAVAGSIDSSRSTASRTARSARSGSAASEPGPTMRRRRAVEVGPPAVGVEQRRRRRAARPSR